MHQCRTEVDARSKIKLEWHSLSISFSRYQLVVPVRTEKKNMFVSFRKCSRPQKPDPISDHNCQNLYPFSDQNGSKTIPFGAAHTYIPYIGEYPSPPGPRAKLDSEINAHFLLNKHVDPHFLTHEFKLHKVIYNIS